VLAKAARLRLRCKETQISLSHWDNYLDQDLIETNRRRNGGHALTRALCREPAAKADRSLKALATRSFSHLEESDDYLPGLRQLAVRGE